MRQLPQRMHILIVYLANSCISHEKQRLWGGLKDTLVLIRLIRRFCFLLVIILRGSYICQPKILPFIAFHKSPNREKSVMLQLLHAFTSVLFHPTVKVILAQIATRT